MKQIFLRRVAAVVHDRRARTTAPIATKPSLPKRSSTPPPPSVYRPAIVPSPTQAPKTPSTSQPTPPQPLSPAAQKIVAAAVQQPALQQQTPPQPGPDPSSGSTMTAMALPAAAQKIVAAVVQSTQTMLQPGVDYACNNPSKPGVCFGLSPRAKVEYMRLQNAINNHAQAVGWVGLGQRFVAVTEEIDEPTRSAVARLIKETSKMPYSNMVLYPWQFTAAIEALPKTKTPITTMPVTSPERKSRWPWLAVGLGGAAAVAAIVAFARN